MSQAGSAAAVDAHARTGWLGRWLRRSEPPAAALPASRDTGLSEPAWARVLARVRAATEADCVFAVEGSGLVVALDGNHTPDEVDRMAAHLSRAYDFLDPLSEIRDGVESICVMFGEGSWLTSVRVKPLPGIVVTVGIVGPYTMFRADRQKVRNAFTKMIVRELKAAVLPV